MTTDGAPSPDEPIAAPALSAQVEARPSPIHGRGVFARIEIPAGTLVGTYTGRPTATNGTHVLWVEDDDGRWTGLEGQGVLRFLNHSTTPNVEFEGADLYARRDIAPGEELVFHYGDDWNDVS